MTSTSCSETEEVRRFATLKLSSTGLIVRAVYLTKENPLHCGENNIDHVTIRQIRVPLPGNSILSEGFNMDQRMCDGAKIFKLPEFHGISKSHLVDTVS